MPQKPSSNSIQPHFPVYQSPPSLHLVLTPLNFDVNQQIQLWLEEQQLWHNNIAKLPPIAITLSMKNTLVAESEIISACSTIETYAENHRLNLETRTTLSKSDYIQFLQGVHAQLKRQVETFSSKHFIAINTYFSLTYLEKIAERIELFMKQELLLAAPQNYMQNALSNIQGFINSFHRFLRPIKNVNANMTREQYLDALTNLKLQVTSPDVKRKLESYLLKAYKLNNDSDFLLLFFLIHAELQIEEGATPLIQSLPRRSQCFALINQKFIESSTQPIQLYSPYPRKFTEQTTSTLVLKKLRELRQNKPIANKVTGAPSSLGLNFFASSNAASENVALEPAYELHH